MTVEQIKASLTGKWKRIAPEIRPSIAKTSDGGIKPFFLTREFTYSNGDKFQLDLMLSYDDQ